MRSSPDIPRLRACESEVAALYRCVWDSYLGDRHEALLNELFQNRLFPATVSDAAAATGRLAVRQARNGQKVTANELSPSMRYHLPKRKSDNVLTDSFLNVLQPAACWRSLPDAIRNQSFGLVLCLGAALAHCDNTPAEMLKESSTALASLVEQDGFLLVHCKRYAEDRCELQCDGSKRPLEISDPDEVKWTDLQGLHRKGTLRSSFSISKDRSLTRVFLYHDFNSPKPQQLKWTIHTWPVAKPEDCRIISGCGMRLVREIVAGGKGKKLPVDNLLFRKDPLL